MKELAKESSLLIYFVEYFINDYYLKKIEFIWRNGF